MHSQREIEIVELAESQAGVVSREQLLAHGLGEDAIDFRLRSGRLRRLARGVYAVGHGVLTERGELWAVLLSCGPDAVLSHFSAAARHHVLRVPPLHHVTTSGRKRSSPGLRVHRNHLTADDVVLLDGLPVTSLMRTLIDLAGVTTPRVFHRALDAASVQHGFDDVETLLARSHGRPGARMIRAAAEDRMAGLAMSESELEERFLELLFRAALPLPQQQVQLGEYRVDFAWPEHRLIVEVDGMRSHLTPQAFQRDRERDRELRRRGWRVERFTWHDIVRNPEATVLLLREILLTVPLAA